MINNRAEFQVGENDKSVSYPFPHHLPPFLHEVGQTAATHVSVSCQEKQLKIRHIDYHCILCDVFEGQLTSRDTSLSPVRLLDFEDGLSILILQDAAGGIERRHDDN